MMKAKSLIKRAFALALTVVLLVSCWVFSAPTATEAGATNTGGNYTLWIKIKVTNKADKKDNIQTSKMTVTYKENNGTGTESTKEYNLKDIWNTSRPNGPGLDSEGTGWFKLTGIPGFPSKVTIYHDAVWTDKVHYKIYSFAVGGSSGTADNGPSTGITTRTGDPITSVESGGVGNGAYDDWWGIQGTLPYLKSGGTISCSNVQLLADQDTASGTVTISSGTDQYGISYSPANCTLTQGGSTSYFSISGTTFTAKKSCHKSADNVNSQTVTITATWAGSTSVTKTCTATILDEWYTAKWYYTTTNTSNLASPTTTNYKTTTQQYGEYWKDAKPTDIPVDYYHTASKHYTGGSFSVSGWAQNNTTTFTMTYTENDHDWSYSKLASNNSNYGKKHTKTCKESTCAYSVTEAHAAFSSSETTAATCTAAGATKYTCDLCSYNYTDNTVPAALGHEGADVAKTTTPTDGGAKITYYECDRCHTSWGATYVPATHTYVKDEDNEVAATDGGEANIAAVEANTSTENMMAPAPAFNNFSVNYESGSVQGNFPYQNRLAQLKLENDNAVYVDKNTTQALRFAGAVSVPAGVSLAVGSTEITDNVVTDFGFVYTQDRYISNADVLVIGGTTDIPSSSGKVYEISKYSVKDANSGVFNGSNWTGVTQRGDNGHYSLTFNLLLSIYAKNWNRAYAARPYITYKYHGVEYTVYDEGTTTGTTGRTYSCASVAYIATHVVANSAEPLATRNYIQSKIVDHLAEQSGYTANPEK